MNSINGLKQTALEYLLKPLITTILITLLSLLLLTQCKNIAFNIGNSIWEVLFPANPAPVVEVRNIIIGGLQEMSELTTGTLTTKATVVTSQESKISRFSIGNTNVVYEAVGTVQAGVNMKELEAKEVDIKNHKIHIILPPPHISDVSLDVNGSHVVAHYKEWFGPSVELELQEKAQKEGLRKITAEACSNQLLESANKNAKQLVEGILRTAKYEEITVEAQPPKPGACLLT